MEDFYKLTGSTINRILTGEKGTELNGLEIILEESKAKVRITGEMEVELLNKQCQECAKRFREGGYCPNCDSGRIRRLDL